MTITGNFVLPSEKATRHEHLAGTPTKINWDFRERQFYQAEMIAVGVAQEDAVNLGAGAKQTLYGQDDTPLYQVIAVWFTLSRSPVAHHLRQGHTHIKNQARLMGGNFDAVAPISLLPR